MGPSPSLSQLLKEAKAESAAAQAVSGDVDTGPLPLTYSRLFDEYHGERRGEFEAIMW